MATTGFSFANLDATTRQFMLDEIATDAAGGRLYMSRHLSPQGAADYPQLLRDAAARHDAAWLARELAGPGRLRTATPRHTSSGGTTMAAVPSNAHEMLAEGEFNRFYIRGVCRRAIDQGIQHVVICRAKVVSRARPESEPLIGSKVDARRLLRDLRESPGLEPALGVPGGPNSGLSVRLP